MRSRVLIVLLLAALGGPSALAARAGGPRPVRKLDARIRDYLGSQHRGPTMTIWGAREPRLVYEHDDRLRQRDPAKHDAAVKAADASGAARSTAGWHKAYLSSLLGRRVNLRHIEAGTSSGHTILTYGFVPARRTAKK